MQSRLARAALVVLFAAVLVALAIPANAAVPEVSAESQSAVVKAIKTVGPAVVNIDTVARPRRTMFDFFPEFFGQPQPQQGQGSGWIYDGQNGYIVTNEHVVHGADQITVTLPDKKQYEAKLVGRDRMSDIAVVKIDAKDLPTAKLSNSGEPVIGSWAIAIGNPFGFQNTVTVGVISATSRRLKAPDGREMEGLLQTDAAINPGNSGGPLCDINGSVVGMNTAIIPYGQGLGFAISAETIAKVVPELIKHGRVIRPWIGFVYADATPRLARAFRVTYADGVIMQVYKGYAADEAGLQNGDIIVEAAGKQIKTAQELESITKNLKIGDRLPLVVVRGGKQLKATVILGEMPAELQG